MRPLFTGIILFLIWLIIASWYYSTRIHPVLNPAEETAISEVAPATSETPPETPAAPVAPEAVTLYFEIDKTAILNTEPLTNFIPQSLKFLKANSGACLIVTGHACDIGPSGYNMKLGTKRTEAVKSYLLSHGFTSECIKTESKGESSPALPNTSEENRKKNRRVQLQIN